MRTLRKLAAILVSVLLMTAVFPLCVSAEAEAVDVDLSEILEEFDDSGIEGRFQNIEGGGISLFVPDFMERAELTEEEKEDGYLAAFRSEEDGWELAAVSIGEADSLEELAEMLDEEEIEYSVQEFNGGKYVICLAEENNAAFVFMENKAGGLQEVVFMPADDDDFMSLAEMMLFTIRPAYVLDWRDFSSENDLEELPGSFRLIEEAGLRIRIPENMAEADLSEQDRKQGYVAYFMGDEGQAVAVQRVPVDKLESFTDKDDQEEGGFTLEHYKDLLVYFDAENVSDYLINGTPALYYELPEYETATVSILDDGGYICEVSFYPVSDEEFARSAAAVMASIRIPGVMSWEEAEPFVDEFGLEGEFVTFEEAGIKMWVPKDLKPSEELEEIREYGYIAYYEDEFRDAVAAVLYGETDMDLDGFIAYAEENGATNGDVVLINGREAYCYDLEEKDVTCVTYVSDGHLLEISFYPYPDEEYLNSFIIMAASIQEE